jgi:phospholipid N-methyltransferase
VARTAGAISGRLAERARFLRSFLAHPRQVGAVLPTSRRAVSDMLDLARFDDARVVVEFGAGTGVYTEAVLARLRPDARLLAFELDPSLAAGMRERLDDPRLEVLGESAEHVERHLGGERADVLISAIPFTSVPAEAREKILSAAQRVLAPEGLMLVLQYSPFIQSELQRRFASVTRTISPLNVPPAFLFACRRSRAVGEPAAR